MTRMSKEFSLVLLGATVLTAGAFLWPEEDAVANEQKQAAAHVGGTTHQRSGMMFLYIPHGGWRGGSATSAGASRGGFGSIGRVFSGGGVS